ncbi:MAG: NADH-quinone oxidoreductase subunit A [Chitinivibrionia bacterium]|nr:NADH-quinone oxidoreductase subunit A [Chitinivibrionia bacterium]
MLLVQKYLPILMLFCLAVIVPIALLALSSMIGPKKETPDKAKTFECGNDPVGEPRKRFSVQFFLVALLFE